MRILTLRSLPAAAALVALAACSPSKGEDMPIRVDLGEPTVEGPLPGLIEPEGAQWETAADGRVARFGFAGARPLLAIVCRGDRLSVFRDVPADAGTKALLAFVGPQGILRVPVANDGELWRGAYESGDYRWRALTGGKFYATVAGGGRLLLPAMGAAQKVIADCEEEEESATPPGAGSA